jgi:hypothetical protein
MKSAGDISDDKYSAQIIIVLFCFCVVVYAFAPVKDGGYVWPEYINPLVTILWNFIYFIPVFFSGLFAGNFHYYNTYGFFLGMLLEGWFFSHWFVRRLNHKSKVD